MGSSSLLEYFPDDSVTILLEWPEVISKSARIIRNYEDIYSRKHKSFYTPLPSTLLDLTAPERIYENGIKLQALTSTAGAYNFNMKSIQSFQGRIKNVREDMTIRLDSGWRVIMTPSFDGQASRVFDLFYDFRPDADFENYNPESDFNIILSPLNNGVELNEIKTIVLTDHDIFGKSYRKRKHFKRKGSRPIESFLNSNG
jgi:transcription-repair coupling factor (superfamily II helicase)